MKKIFASIKNVVKESGLVPSFKVREKLAASYLRGEGLEIGALHFPLKAPPGVVVKYVDVATREENIRRFPDVDGSRIVDTDYVENGFELASIADASQDFIIANHVLEHADNPLKVLLNWSRVLKPEGIMMVTVPEASRCFDKGRCETQLEHFIDDYRLNESGEIAMFREKNREHFSEWLQISERNFIKMRGGAVPAADGDSLEKRLEEMSEAANMDIHFHTFSRASFGRLVNYFASDFARNFQVLEIRSARGGAEVVAMLKKLS